VTYSSIHVLLDYAERVFLVFFLISCTFDGVSGHEGYLLISLSDTNELTLSRFP
jgi:hypothetical protein